MDAGDPPPPRRRTVRLPDGTMSVLEFGDAARPVDAVFVHANGFNAQTYRTVLQPLGADLRIWAPDLRGHGETRLPADPATHRSWDVHGADLVALLSALEGPAPVVSGHSMGASSGLLAAARASERVRALVMFEPVILSRRRAWGARLPGARAQLLRRMPLAKGALARRASFPDREAALAAYRGRGAFRTWPEASLADYVAGGFREAGGGGVELACSPAWEAANYAAQRADVRGALRRVRMPVRILKGDHGSTCAIRHSHPGLEVETVAGAGHFLPLERPDLVRDALRAAAAR